ncbi:pyridoxamine 5'-phosphate oxidase family protein [Agromyces archimandritae]|uniref:Pyridoxamine 5'-phosphate oxidase family protein n=1 Tax=Agromyces archimandritae TaxID=2781962 RepID=A0A975FLS3_9MICO|nr:pyridoxamine 5'-phosphate oxidase family protein [Agromyces archimandritae]QTX04449.1 pyridoxamine 5'-phosphate oxidase family protein [Agromyces archimandritae]
MSDPHAIVTELSENECWALLVAGEFGRFAVAIGSRPEIFPVNYRASDGSILIRTAEGTKLFGVGVNDEVAFEVDDYTATEAWSVIVRGRARVLESPAEIAEAERVQLRPWARTPKTRFIRVDAAEVTGRRFTFGSETELAYV